MRNSSIAASENLFPSHDYSKINESYLVNTPPKVKAEDCSALILAILVNNGEIRRNINKYEFYMDNASIYK